MKSIIKLIHKIRSSFTTQLTIWMAGGVLVISAVVIILLARYSQQVIKDESLETSQQLLENMAVRISNELRLADISARLEHREFKVTKPLIEKLMEGNDQLTAIKQSLPHIQFYVMDSAAAGADDPSQQEEQQVYTFQQDIYDRQFSIVAVCPATDLYEKYADMQFYLLLRGIIGVLVLLIILWRVILRHLHPLHVLADSAQRIADGHLDERIPDTHHQDEISQLQSSLFKMQHSLADYMEEMRHKQDTLNRQNAQLQKAYSEAQEYERVKEKFIHDMAGQLAQPVDTVCRNTYSICADYKTLSKAEMAKNQINILQGTEDIVALLNQSFTADK